ncbi:ABC transporter permease [Streptomyces sp. J2-1]|uniref:ABC transporter permease n=1 Tax=Streptomyces corallincola TaxID=2851888 RepID=UPI001C386E04|nr:ABC transporter permease [Streptomyces corallincola]
MSTQQPALPPTPAPDGQYRSPIPVVRTHLGHALASEWTKIRSVRSTMWTLGVFLLLVIGIGLLTGIAVRGTGAREITTNPLGLGLFGLLVGCLCVITLGVLTTTSEYGTGMIRTTTTACPSRGRVLAAKSIVFSSVAFVVTLAASSLVAMLQVALLDGQIRQRPSGGAWLRATLGISLYVALLGLLALLVGSMIRHSAGAITLMVAAVLAPLVLALFMAATPLETVRDALLEYSIPNQLSVLYSTSLGASGPTGWDPLWIMLGVTAVAYAAAHTLLNSRDV